MYSNFENIVDHVIILTCVKYRGRIPFLMKEIDRVGIPRDRIEFVTQYPNPFESRFMKRIPHTDGMDDPVKANIWFGHYRALKIGYELGYERVMIMEDDIRFLTDVEYINKALSEVPNNFYMLHLDPVTDHPDRYRDGVRIAKGLGVNSWGVMGGPLAAQWLHSAGCMIMSRECMKNMIWIYEASIDTNIPNRMLRPPDMWFDLLTGMGDNVLLYAAPNIAVQTCYDNPELTGWSGPGAQKSYRGYLGNLDTLYERIRSE